MKKYYYIVFDSEEFRFVRCDNKDRLCDVIEIISNKCLHGTLNQCKPYIAYVDAIKANEEVTKCLAEKDKDGKPYYEAENITFFLYKITQELISAVKEGNLEVVISLLKVGADVHAKDEDNCPILSIATYMGNSKVVDRLLASNPFINAQDKDGFTALSHAARKGRLAVIISLVSHNPDINLQDNHGNTPLHWALEKGNRIAMIILIKVGADISIENADGKTALDLAQEYGHQEIVTLLKEKQ